MANYTSNYNLEKPLQDDFYDVDVQNSNMDKIDAALNETAEAANDHIANKNNPHGVSCNQIGALPLNGGTMKGAIISSTNVFVTNSANKTSALILSGETPNANGASLQLYPVTNTSHPGGFQLGVRNTNDTANLWLVGKSDGSLVWNSKNIVRSINNTQADANGNVTLDITNHTHDYLPLSGGTLTDVLNGTTIKLNGSIYSRSDNHRFHIGGGTGWQTGAHIVLSGKDSTDTGAFILNANNGTNQSSLFGGADGILKWGNKNIVRSINGVNADANGNAILSTLKNGNETVSVDADGNIVSSGYRITRDVDDEFISLVGGTSTNTSSYVQVVGGSNSNGGEVYICAKSANGDQAVLSVEAEGKLSFMARDISNPIKDASISGQNITLKFADNSTKTLTTQNKPSDMNDYIVETYQNGYSWYRVWESGLIEQGGRYYTSSYKRNIIATITFQKAFSSKANTITITPIDVNTSSTSEVATIGVSSIRKTSFLGRAYGHSDDDTPYGFYWYACGY